jgi:hypothetical protein
VVWAALSYLLVATLALWPSIRPGRTLVPADTLIIVTPYAALPSAREPDNLQLSDAAFQFFPWFAFVAEGLRDGEIRQWNPYLLAGLPVTPNGNVSPYYPPTWLAAVLSPFDAYDLFVLLHLVLGALGVYVVGRTFGIRPLASWVAGLLAFTAAFWVHWSTHLVHLAGMVWMPWLLAATWWVVTGPSLRRTAALAAVAGLWLLGGSPQYLYFGSLALAGWVVTLLAGRRLRSRKPVVVPAAAFALAMALGALVAAPVLLPTLATSGQVVRARETEAPTGHVPRREAIRALVPGATGNPADHRLVGSNDELRMDAPFLGVTAVVLAGAALGGLGGRARGRLLLAGGAAASLLLAFTALPHQVLFEVVPGYDRFRSSPRWLFLLPAFALPLAALGLQDLLAGARRARTAMVATAGTAGVAVVAWFAWAQGQPGAPVAYFRSRALLAGGVLAVVAGAGWVGRTRPRLALAVVAAAALGEVAFHTPRWYPKVDQATAYPRTEVSDLAAARGGRIITVGVRSPFPTFGPDISMLYGVADAGGLSVLFPKDYDRYLRLIDDYGIYAQEFNVAPSLSRGELLASPLLDALDVRTVLAERDVAIPAEYHRLVPLSTEPWAYARPSPGGAVVVAAAQPATEEGMWAAVAAPAWDPSATAAVLGLRGPVVGTGGTATPGPAPPDRERWEVEAPAGGFLRVSARWAEGWSATVGGRPAAVLRADGVFRGVIVPPGRHTVEFSYRNTEEMRGRWVAGGALAALAALVVAPGKVRRRRQPNGPRERLKG